MRSLLISVCVLIGAHSYASFYQQVERAFLQGREPEIVALSGVWAGRCVMPQAPGLLRPSVYLFSAPQPATLAGATQTFYWSRDSNTTKFDFLGVSSVLNEPSVNAWLQKEQWNSVTSDGTAFHNEYRYPNSSPVVRSVKRYRDAQADWVILQVSKDGNPLQYCFYQRYLGAWVKTPEPEKPPGEPTSFLIGTLGPTLGGELMIQNTDHAGKPLTHVEFKNVGKDAVRVSHLLVRFFPEGVFEGQEEHWIQPGASQAVWVAEHPERVDRVYFYLFGATEKLEVRGLRKTMSKD